jgi:diaminopropionate ammonia-lyase
MEGYTALAREALREMAPPTHVFLQAGCGGLAAAVAGHLALVLPDRPRTIVVEPARAACVFESARLGRPVRIEHGAPTVMAMLECYEPSHRAWRVLTRIADAFMTLEEDAAVETMRLVAAPAAGDPAIVAGESGCVGLAGFLHAVRDAGARRDLGLDGHSRILVVNSEGATDPERYAALVGRPPAAVAA